MNVVPKKALGQHFLVDENILGVIERLAGLEPGDVVLEVGPGLGVLTRYLAARVAHVHAVELDRSLEPSLRGLERTTIHWRDALTLEQALMRRAECVRFDSPAVQVAEQIGAPPAGVTFQSADSVDVVLSGFDLY